MVEDEQSSQGGSYACGGASVQKERTRAVKRQMRCRKIRWVSWSKRCEVLLRRVLLGVAGLREWVRPPRVTPQEVRRRSAAYRRFGAARTDNRGMHKLHSAHIQAISQRRALRHPPLHMLPLIRFPLPLSTVWGQAMRPPFFRWKSKKTTH